LLWPTNSDTLAEVLDEAQYGCSDKAILNPAPDLVPLLRIPNVIRGRIDYSDLVWLEDAEEYRQYRLVPGDVLIVRTNGNPEYVGRTAVYENSHFDQCFFASYLIRLRPKSDRLLPQFLHEMLQSDLIKKELRKHVRSSAGNYNLNAKAIRGLRIPLPTMHVQQQFIQNISSIGAVAGSFAKCRESLVAFGTELLNGLLSAERS
jgi:type I restriction enzyme S subunit